jgi:hypothetical protein
VPTTRRRRAGFIRFRGLSLILIIGAALALLVVRYALVITTSFQRRTASDKDCSAPAAQPRGTRREPAWTIVLEGRARAGADEADVDGVEVVHAPGEGDDTIAAIAEANRDVVVVTADRELADRVRAANAEVVGPSWLLDQLVD